jgi:hypothetical protein
MYLTWSQGDSVKTYMYLTWSQGGLSKDIHVFNCICKVSLKSTTEKINHKRRHVLYMYINAYYTAI